MHTRNWRRGFVTSVILLLALIAAALLVGVRDDNSGDNGPSGPTSTTTTTTTAPEPDEPAPLDPELQDVLTIRSTTVDCVNIVEEAEGRLVVLEDGTSVYQYRDDSLAPVGDGGRLWADAISTSVKADDPKAALDEAILAICQGPLYGTTWMHLFAHLEVGGVKLVDLNPWLEPARVEATEINDLALSFVKEHKGKKGVAEYVVSPDYILKAEYVAELLTRFRLVGFFAEQSVLNYHLVAGGLVVGTFPEVEVNSVQENLPALVLELNQKTGECLSRIGFNLLDKRPEIFSCSPSSVVVPCTSNCGTALPTTTVVVCGDKNHFDESGNCVPNFPTGSPLPPPPTTAPGATTTTLACVYGTHRDLATGLCVSDSPPDEDPAPDPPVPDGSNDGPVPGQGV